MFKTLEKIKFNSEPLKQLIAETEKSCWDSCLEVLNCVSTSFSNQKVCNLFESEELEYIEDINWTSYSFKLINNITTNNLEKETSYRKAEPIIYKNVQFANYFNLFDNYTASNCWNDCVNNEYCDGISFLNDTCKLYHNPTEFIEINNWTSKSFRKIDLEKPLVYENTNLFDSYKFFNQSSEI